MPFQLEDGSGLVVVESTGEIWLENDVASGGIKWPRCCCQEPIPDCGNCCSLHCVHCSMPNSDLTLSWTGGYGSWASGSITLYSQFSTGSNPTYTGGPYTDSSGAIFNFIFQCWTNPEFLLELDWLDCIYGEGNPNCICYVAYGGPVNYSCNPLSVTFSAGTTNSDFSGFCLADGLGGQMESIVFKVESQGSGYGVVTCCQKFDIRGCNSLALPGATVSVYDTNGGTLLAQTITPANGFVTLLWDGSCSIYVTVAATRFTSYGQSLTIGQTGTTLITLAASSGYHCLATCSIPLPDTLNATFTVAGTQTFTFSGSSWTSSFTSSGHSYVASIAQNGIRTITRDGTSCGTIGGGISACPMSFAATMIPPSGDCLDELGTAILTE